MYYEDNVKHIQTRYVLCSDIFWWTISTRGYHPLFSRGFCCTAMVY